MSAPSPKTNLMSLTPAFELVYATVYLLVSRVTLVLSAPINPPAVPI